MKLPVSLILKILISQIFFVVASSFIELSKTILVKSISSRCKGLKFLRNYAIYIYPIISIIFFLILGISLFIFLNYLTNKGYIEKVEN